MLVNSSTTNNELSDADLIELTAYSKVMERNQIDMEMNIKTDLIEKADTQGHLSDQDFAALLRSMLVSENGYVIDTGSSAHANAEIALRLANKIKKHPLIWKLLFMVA